MTHLNFSVEQHGGIYILLSGYVSTFFSSSNIEKIQKILKYVHNTHTHTQKHTHKEMLHISWKQTENTCSRRQLYSTAACLFLIIEVIKYICLVEPWSLSSVGGWASYL